MLADALEAVLGAIYLDGGFASAEKVVVAFSLPYCKTWMRARLEKTLKPFLQEYLQSHRLALPQYSVIATARRGSPAAIQGRMRDCQTCHPHGG